MATIIRPLRDKVLLKRTVAENKTKGGIIIPDNAKEKPVEGEVLAIGPEVKDIQPGNVVLFGKYAGSEVKVDDEEYILLTSENILGVIEAG